MSNISARHKDVSFNEQGMVINIVSSKTDQYREGASLVIAHTGTPTCPVSNISARHKDVSFNEQGMVINIVSSKTDQYREGASLVIAHTGTHMPCE